MVAHNRVAGHLDVIERASVYSNPKLVAMSEAAADLYCPTCHSPELCRCRTRGDEKWGLFLWGVATGIVAAGLFHLLAFGR